MDELARLTAPELLALYHRGHAPLVSQLRGDLQGRMLAVRGASGTLARLLGAFAALRYFPWRGKSFAPRSAGVRGDGINRVLSDVRPRRWFRFETYAGPSRADAAPALQLDYDNADNPFFIRAIKDELRAIGPSLYLGQAYVVVGGKPRLALYFALQGSA